MIKVLLADDEAMVRAGVRAILAAAPDIEVVVEAGDGREALELVGAHRPDVAVLDIRMPSARCWRWSAPDCPNALVAAVRWNSRRRKL